MPAALARPRWTAHVAADLGFVVFALVAAFALFHDAWASPATRLIGVSEDPTQNVWLLRLTQHALAHGSAPWTTTLIDAPSGVNLMWSPLMPLASLLLWPVTATAGPVVAYNVLATLTPVLSAVAAYVALRYFVRDRVASWIGALLYGFSPYAVAQLLGHPHAALGITPPLLLVVLNEVLIRRHGSARRNGLLLAALVTVQFFLSVEVLASEVVMTVIGVAILAIRYRNLVVDRLADLLRMARWALPAILIVCGWPLWVLLAGPGHVSGTIWPPGEFSADLLNLVVPSALVQFAPASLQEIPFHIDSTAQVWSAYVGVPLLLLVVVALVRLRWRFDAAFLATMFAACLILSLGPSLRIAGHDTGTPLPMRFVMLVPGLGNLEPDRVALYAYLFAAMLIALLVAELRLHSSGRAFPAIAVAVVCLSLAPTLRFPAESADVPPFFTGSAATTALGGTTTLVLPLADSEHVAPMLWQAEGDFAFAMTAGYAIRPLPGGGATTSAPQTQLAQLITGIERSGAIPLIDPGLRQRLREELRTAGVDTIVAGPDRRQPALVGFVTNLVAAPPRWEGGVALWRLSPAR